MQVTPDEVDILLQEGEKLAPSLASTRILRAYAGVRPLVATDDDPSGRNISRGIVLLDHETRDGVKGFISITGGKLMTYRLMAEWATDLVCKKLAVNKSCVTMDVPLPGSELENIDEISKKTWTKPGTTHKATVGRHGNRANLIDLKDDYDTRVVQSINYSSPFRVEDEGTNDGWAIHSTTGFSATGSGIKINFNHLDLSQYSSIYVRVKTTVNGSNNNRIDINGNDTYFVYGGYNDYTTIDLLPYFLKNGFTHLDNIQLSAKTATGIGIYVDEIVLVKKEDAPKYDDLTLNAEQLLQFAGTPDNGHFSGGNIVNINADSVNVGAYQGKDSVLTFTTTAHGTSNYSGGGLYIDLRDYVASGKIVVSQDFTVSITVYVTQNTGFRHGVISGANLETHSFNNYWVTASGNNAWVTYTVSSAELRAISGCSNVEMTGIYIASAGPVGSTFAVESVSIDFVDAQ